MKSIFFPRFVEKIEKLKLGLSKQHNKMLKIRSEMLKTRKKKPNNRAREIFPGMFQIPETPWIFEIPKIFRNYLEFFKKFSVSREVKNPGKKETLLGFLAPLDSFMVSSTEKAQKVVSF